MLCNKNESLESRNFIDGVDFTRNDPCIFVVYPPGAAGDLLISIIDKHYLRTGCEYYGISDSGRVHIYTADYEFMDLNKNYMFDNQWFYNLAESLGNRNLNYSLLDQIIFGCHMHQELQHILETFPQAKIIRIAPADENGCKLISSMASLKLGKNIVPTPMLKPFQHNQILTVPFGVLFNEKNYYKWYDEIIKFLNLNGRLICFDYVKYYLSRQSPKIQSLLVEYSKNL